MINAKKEIYIRYTMDNIAVTSVMPGGKASSPSDVPAEVVTLRPSVIRWEYLPTSQEKTGAAIKHGWNFPEQRKQDT
jgi:type VI protein secretion system component Hcp